MSMVLWNSECHKESMQHLHNDQQVMTQETILIKPHISMLDKWQKEIYVIQKSMSFFSEFQSIVSFQPLATGQQTLTLYSLP
jgi:hypothetical protein